MTSFNINTTEPCIEIICGVGETDVTVQVKDMYEFWKDWFLDGDNSKYLPAMDSSGGEPLGGGESLGEAFFLFCSNGWKICPITTESEVTIRLQGNLFASPATETLFDYHDVAGKCFIELRTSTLPSTIETGVSGLTPTESSQLAIIDQVLVLNEKINKLVKLIPAAI